MLRPHWTHALRSFSRQGGWTAFIYFIVSLILTVALSPKPPKPKAAALEDFDVPIAEEDRPIPVLFGTKRITGANVVWYGRLQTTKIKKGGLTGSTTVGYKYFLGMHMALGHGPWDAITKIETADKEAWSGNVTANATITINQPNLYGGKEREGGIVGDVDVCMGASTQAPNEYLADSIRWPLLDTDVPAFRGVTCLVWKGGYIGNTPYVKAWAVTARRILQGWSGGSAWYPEAAAIGTGMNPAHIIYQCLTDTEWGQGSPTNTIDTDSFAAAADTLLAEGFGLNLLWNQATKIEDFINIVLDHIAGILTFNQATGQYMLELIRGDYDIEALETFGPETISEVSNFERRSWGETVNELTITYTDAATGKATTITVQDLGNIRSQGVRIADTIDMSGVNSDTLIRSVAGRELAARSTPLTKFDFRCNRRLWRYKPGDVVKLTWPAYDVPVIVFRVLQLGRGTLADGKMTVSVIEDIYALGGIEYAESQPPEDQPEPPFDPEEPNGNPNVIDNALSTPPGDAADGDRYFIPVGTTATGAWAGQEGRVAERDTSGDAAGEPWLFEDVPAGTIIFNEETGSHFSVDEYGAVIPPPWVPASSPLISAALNLSMFHPGIPTSSRLMFQFTSPENWTLPGNMVDSKGHVGTNPTGSFVMNVQLNGSTVGTITVATTGVFTFATTGANPVTIVAGDKITIVAPSSTDATVADISATLVVVGEIADAGAPTRIALGLWFPGTPASNQLVMKTVAARGWTWPANWSTSYGDVGTNPTGTFVLTVNVNGASVGTISISTGGVFTFATTLGADIFVDAGDVIDVEAQSATDATVANIGATLAGVLT